MTTGAPDVADCYEVEVDPADSLRYRYDGEWRRMETHDVTIEVRGGDPVARTFAYTRHNDVLSPVVARQDGKAYVVSTSYMHTAGDLDQEIYEINHATNIAGVKQAMRRLGMFPQNVHVRRPPRRLVVHPRGPHPVPPRRPGLEPARVRQHLGDRVARHPPA